MPPRLRNLLDNDGSPRSSPVTSEGNVMVFSVLRVARAEILAKEAKSLSYQLARLNRSRRCN